MESIKTGILKSSALNFLSRVFGYLRYVAIAILFGLNSETDAFFVAYAIVGIMLVFVDVFDSLGVPRLVRARQESEEIFNKVSSSLLSFAALCSFIFSVLLISFVLLIGILHPQIGALDLSTLRKNLVLLWPFAASGFFIHYFGAVLRSKRRFTVYFIGELMYSFFSFLFTLIGLMIVKDSAVLSLSLSIAQLINLLYMGFASKDFWSVKSLRLKDIKEYLLTFLFLSGMYGIFYLFTIIDKFFATLLETKSVSAISYGLLVAGAVKGIFKIEQVLVTKISEVSAEIRYVTRLLTAVFIFSVVLLFIVFSSSTLIVDFLFGYGNFSLVDVNLTSEALRYYALSIPFFFLWPIVFRIYQTIEILKPVFIISIVSIILNFVLNYYFVIIAKMGIMGICLGTFGAYGFLTLSSIAYLFYLRRRGLYWT